MTKKLVIPTSVTKAETIAAVEKSLSPKKFSENSYRFTAVLPEALGQELRIHCARKNLKLKDVLADAVRSYLDSQTANDS